MRRTFVIRPSLFRKLLLLCFIHTPFGHEIGTEARPSHVRVRHIYRKDGSNSVKAGDDTGFVNLNVLYWPEEIRIGQLS